MLLLFSDKCLDDKSVRNLLKSVADILLSEPYDKGIFEPHLRKGGAGHQDAGAYMGTGQMFAIVGSLGMPVRIVYLKREICMLEKT